MLLTYRNFLVKERVAVLKLTDTYDIFDPETGDQIGIAVDKPSTWATIARMFLSKRFLPTRIEIMEDESQGPVMTLVKKPGFLRVEVALLDSQDQLFGSFRSKLFKLGGGFVVHDPEGAITAEVNGDWKGWNFSIVSESGRRIGEVTKKWAGIGKEFFTSADSYVISVGETEKPESVALVLAAGLAVDTVFKEV